MTYIGGYFPASWFGDWWQLWGEGSGVLYTAIEVDCGIPAQEIECGVPAVEGWAGVPAGFEVTI